MSATISTVLVVLTLSLALTCQAVIQHGYYEGGDIEIEVDDPVVKKRSGLVAQEIYARLREKVGVTKSNRPFQGRNFHEGDMEVIFDDDFAKRSRPMTHLERPMLLTNGRSFHFFSPIFKSPRTYEYFSIISQL